MFMQQLKEQTRELHAAAEAAVDLTSRLASPADYREFLSLMYGFYAPLERRLAEVVPTDLLLFDLEHHWKTPLLIEDLKSLGTNQPEQLPQCDVLPVIDSEPASVGALYVLEGATLGGQIIRREVERRFGFTPDHGCRFFSGYGEQTRENWQAFCNAVEAFVGEHSEAASEIIASAGETFARFEEWIARR